MPMVKDRKVVPMARKTGAGFRAARAIRERAGEMSLRVRVKERLFVGRLRRQTHGREAFVRALQDVRGLDAGDGEGAGAAQGVVKDAELFAFKDDSSVAETEEEAKRRFADIWKMRCFGWEYKGKRKSLDEAYKQLFRHP